MYWTNSLTKLLLHCYPQTLSTAFINRHTLHNSLILLSLSLSPPSPSPTHSQGGEEFMSKTLSRIQYVVDPVGAAQKSDLVVEAIVENMAAKHELFSTLDKAAPQ